MTAAGNYASPPFDTLACGGVRGSLEPGRLPDVPCKRVVLKALRQNRGDVYLGTGPEVEVFTDETDRLTGLQLGPGEQVVLDIDNLNKLWRVCTDAQSGLTYLALG